MKTRKTLVTLLAVGMVLGMAGTAQALIYEQVGGTATVPDGTYDENSGIYDGAVTYIDSAGVIFEERLYGLPQGSWTPGKGSGGQLEVGRAQVAQR